MLGVDKTAGHDNLLADAQTLVLQHRERLGDQVASAKRMTIWSVDYTKPQETGRKTQHVIFRATHFEFEQLRRKEQMAKADVSKSGEIDEILYRKYKNIILKEFTSNRQRAFNPNALFFYAFTDSQTDVAEQYILEVLKRHARPHFVVDCSGKRYRQIQEEIVDGEFGRNQRYELHKQFEKSMRLGSGSTFVFKTPSQIKGETKEGRVQIARELMKILDDAHHDGINTMSDVILIDRASFLESGWDYLSPYVTLVPPIKVGFEELLPAAKHSESSIWPVED